MTITKEVFKFSEIELWCEAEETADWIYNHGGEEQFFEAVDAEFPQGIKETELNHLLRFDGDAACDMAGVPHVGEKTPEEKLDEEEEEEEKKEDK